MEATRDHKQNERVIVPRSEYLAKFLTEVPPEEDKQLPVWDGRAFVMQKPGAQAQDKFTFSSGENMVGQSETPCASTTRLIGSRHRFVNAPDNSKEGYLWRPGNRYTNRNLKIDSIAEGEAVLKMSRYVPHMLDDNKVAFNTGQLMWNEDRFKHVPGRVGYSDYEAMCKKIGETSKWELSRPESKFEPGFAEYTSRPMDYDRRIAAEQPAAAAPPGTYTVKEATGETTVVPETRAEAAAFGNTCLVPAERGAVPNGAAAFAVHRTPQADLRWLTRVVSQRTSGSVPIHGPGSVPFFESSGFAHTTSQLLAAPSAEA